MVWLEDLEVWGALAFENFQCFIDHFLNVIPMPSGFMLMSVQNDYTYLFIQENMIPHLLMMEEA